MDKQTFIEQMKGYAIEQQVKYGIPASVTLAQAIIESSYGNADYTKATQNYFGIHAPKPWIDRGDPVKYYNDHGEHAPFTVHKDAEASFEYHSRFLIENSNRYGKAFAITESDPQRRAQAWVDAICQGGYAGSTTYNSSLMREINNNNLTQYDRLAEIVAQRRGLACGYALGKGYTPTSAVRDDGMRVADNVGYRMPIDGKVEVTSLFGHRHSPTAGASSNHKGIDIRAKFVDVYSMEDGGKVIAVNPYTKYQDDVRNAAGQVIHRKGDTIAGGKSVTVEYSRQDGSRYTVSFCHLDQINVSKDQVVNTDTVIAKSGNTGVGTAPHLHLTVRHQPVGGSLDHIDPLKYLAEISVRGNMSNTVLEADSQKDLLADLKGGVNVSVPTEADRLLAQRDGQHQNQQQDLAQAQVQQQGQANEDKLSALAHMTDPTQMLTYLMGQGGGIGMSQGGGLIESLISALFMAAFSMASHLGGQGEDMAQNTDMSSERTPEEERQGVIRRQRESVDPARAVALARMNFDAEYPEATQQQGMRLA